MFVFPRKIRLVIIVSWATPNEENNLSHQHLLVRVLVLIVLNFVAIKFNSAASLCVLEIWSPSVREAV